MSFIFLHIGIVPRLYSSAGDAPCTQQKAKAFLTCKGIWTGTLSPGGRLVQMSSGLLQLGRLCVSPWPLKMPPWKSGYHCPHLAENTLSMRVSPRLPDIQVSSSFFTYHFVTLGKLTEALCFGFLIYWNEDNTAIYYHRIKCANVCSVITIWRNVSVFL